MYKYINKLPTVLGIILILMVTACANNPLSAYNSRINPSLTKLSTGHINHAESALSAESNLLYYLEHGTMLRLATRYESSNADFSRADGYINAWIQSYHNTTLGTVSDTIVAGMLNGRALDYVAKDYEQVMLPTYKALNDIDLGQWGNARIEITRMYNLENIIANFHTFQYAKAQEESQKYPELSKKFMSLQQVELKNSNNYDFNDINSPAVLALKNSYQNAFSHYLAGFIFEALNEPSLARPGYIHALELDPNSHLIQQSIINLDQGNTVDDSSSDLLLVAEVGHAPELSSQVIHVPFSSPLQDACFDIVNISLPKLLPDKTQYGDINIKVDMNDTDPQMLTNFNLMAARYLHDNMPNIFMHNLLWASKDLALQETACDIGGLFAGLVADVTTTLLSGSDERTWVTLPREIYVARIRVPRGIHTVQVSSLYGIRQLQVNLTAPYEVLTWRMIGRSIYFDPENSAMLMRQPVSVVSP